MSSPSSDPSAPSPPRPARRHVLAQQAARLIGGGGFYIRLPHVPAAEDVPRYGYGRPSHHRLAEILARHRDDYAAALGVINSYRDELLTIPVEATTSAEPYWRNGFLFGLDAPSLYGFVRHRQPRRYVEIGSGNSTLFVGRARRDGLLNTEITSIDPFPRSAVDGICDRVLRLPLELLDLSIFDDLADGDIVFLDGTHRVFMNSDVTAFFLDVLPRLPPGVLVGIHDVHLPDDYRPEHAARYYSEQYLLAAYLLAECSWFSPVLPCWYASHEVSLRDAAHLLFGVDGIPIEPQGVIFWLEILPRG